MIKEVAKINIAGQKDYFERTMDALHSLGAVEISQAEKETTSISSQTTDKLAKIDYNIAQINFAIKFLDDKKIKFKKEVKKIPLRDKLIKSKIKINEQKLQDLAKNYKWEEFVAECEKTEESLNNIENTIKMLEEKKLELAQWKGIKITANDLGETKSSKTFLGEVSNNTLNNLNDILKDFNLAAWGKFKKNSKKSFILITYHKNIEKKLLEHLIKNNIPEAEIPEMENSQEEEIEKIQEKIKCEKKNIKVLNEKIKNLLKEEKNIKIIFDWLNWQKDKIASSIKTLRTDYLFCITAWVEKEKLETISNSLKKISPKLSIDLLKIEEKENEIPIILKNNKIAQPFEFVTNMYGEPLYNEPDPSAYLAPFFIIFFALALTDAMYGIILAVFAMLAIKVFKLPKENQKLPKLIFYAGIATFVIGALFGGWFGIVLEELPPLIGIPLMKLRLMNPVEEPVKFLILTFILGIIQIITGLSISMYWKIKQGKLFEGMADNGLWILLILSLALWVGLASSLFKILAILAAAGLVLTQGRDAKNIIVKLLKGVLSLYNLTGYFSDMLSYSRLLALGLATGIIAMVINIIAGIASEMIPFVGWLAALIILICGHTFNIGINVLGAYIHSSRLQYVEFFPKFMESGGKTFEPFKKECKYVKLVE